MAMGLPGMKKSKGHKGFHNTEKLHGSEHVIGSTGYANNPGKGAMKHIGVGKGAKDMKAGMEMGDGSKTPKMYDGHGMGKSKMGKGHEKMARAGKGGKSIKGSQKSIEGGKHLKKSGPIGNDKHTPGKSVRNRHEKAPHKRMM